MDYKRYCKEMLITAGLTALTGELYFYPFGTSFRFTIGVITLSFLMLNFSYLSELILISLSGMAVVIFRVFLTYTIASRPLDVAFNLHYPAFFYYLAYGLLLKLFNIKKHLKTPINFISMMALADMGANFVELTVRNDMRIIHFGEVINGVFAIGLTRAFITFSLYWFMGHYKQIIVQEEHQKKYAEIMILLSELKAELFYIKKSTLDLEDAMKSSYEIYQSLNPDENSTALKKKALHLARDIHEIKKDYLRIIAGVGELLPEEDQEKMSLSAIVSIIKANTERCIKTLGNKTELIMHFDEDYIVTNYFSLFSIINNLISNALGAVDGENGEIKVGFVTQGERLKITVEDNGTGIDPRDVSYIFEPGFTTKLTSDGSFSAGLGLTHVKNLVEDLGGAISLDLKHPQGARFELSIPIQGNLIIGNKGGVR